MRVPMLLFRETSSALVLVYQYVISSTEPRAQAVSTVEAAQTSEIFGFLAVFEVLHSLMLYTTSLRSAILVLAHQWACSRETLPVSCDTRIRSMYLARIMRVRTVPYNKYGTAVLVPKYARFLWYLIVRVKPFTLDFWSGNEPRIRTRMNAYE